MENIDEFLGKVIRVGGSLTIVIPNKNCEFSGIKEGDFLKVLYRKIIKEE